MKNAVQSSLLAGALLATVSVPSWAQNGAVSVNLDGQPLALSAAPLQLNGRTLLPLRDVFESLGASVNWNPIAQSIAAQSGTTQIQLGINNPVAYVNGRNVRLDQPAVLVGGRAYVPLRFVAEATGARVDYNAPLQLVSIQKSNSLGGGNNGIGGTQVADYNNAPNYYPPANNNTNYLPPVDDDRNDPDYRPPADDYRNDPPAPVNNFRSIRIPSDAVVPVQLDSALSSNTSRVGQNFTATVVSHRMGDSEFPPGTKIEGIITEARPSDKRNPGVLDLQFNNAVLPDGTRVPLHGDLVSLDKNDIQQEDGRLVAQGPRNNSNSDRLKIVGIGAGAGFVLGRVLGTNSTVSTILGAAGGYLFSRSRDRQAQEARLARNTTLGVRLLDPVRFQDANDYSNYRTAFLQNNRAPYDPRDYNYDTRIDASPNDEYDGYQVSDRLPDDYRPNYPDGNTPDNRDDDWNGPRNPDNNGPRDPRDNDDWNNPDNNGPRDDDNWNNGPRDNGGWNTGPRNNGGGWNNGNENWNGDNWNNNAPTLQNISVPEGAVVPIRLDQRISSATARVGDQVSATIDSQQMGDSEFPAGTRILGTVVEARAKQGNDPGVLDFDFRTAQLPDGTRVPLRGELISLDDKGVQSQDGRLVAKQGGSNNDRAKIIGIGAVAGFAIGKIFNKDGVLPPVLGALGGYLYSQKNGRNRAQEAVVPQNARLGLRLDDGISYNGGAYYAARANYLRRN